jgi:hypothetical protein
MWSNTDVRKLSSARIEEYFAEHLSVRVRTLLAHYRMTHERGTSKDRTYSGDVGQLEACYLASLVSGRTVLNLVGVGKDRKGLAPFSFKPDDIGADDLGGKLCTFPLPPADDDLFSNFLRMADKAAAHFTTPVLHPWNRSHEAILRIYDYAKVHLYDATGRSALSVWYQSRLRSLT